MDALKGNRWLRLLVVTAAGLGLTYLLLAITMSGVFGTRLPELALQWRPGDARANAAHANQLLGGAGDGSSEQIRAYARRALRRDPTAIDAVRVLALLDAQSESGRTPRLMRYALLLSRRDLPTHLWYIENYAARSSVSGALFHYDAAMRTSRRARSVLLPVLVSATSHPKVVSELTRLLDRDPAWRDEFLVSLVNLGEDFDASVDLTTKYLDPVDQREADMIQILLNRLVAERRYALAERYYDSVSAETSRADKGERNAEFGETPRFMPFDWILVNEQSFSAQIDVPPGASDPALMLSAADDRSGPMASKLLRLEAGRHRLSAMAGNIDPAGQVYFTVRCIETNRPLLRASAGRADSAGKPVQETFDVPETACPAQWLDIGVTLGSTGGDAEPWVDSVVVTPIG